MPTLSTPLSAGTAAATSTDISLNQGQSAVVGIFSTVTDVLLADNFTVVTVTPGVPTPLGVLSSKNPTFVIHGPGVYRVLRPLLPSAFGVYAYV